MTVLSPLLLLGLAALAVPILLHLLRRRESRTLVFPALRYLARTTREHARIIRLRQLLLLALRLTAILLLVLAGARLVLPLGGRDHPPAGLALIVDNGLTSGAVLGESRVLDSLVARALEALDRTGAQDRVWILPAGEPWRPSVPLTPAEARQLLMGLEPTHVTADLTASIGRAGALLDAAAPELREIVVISDLRPAVIPPAVVGAEPRDDPVRIAPPPPGLTLNRGVAEVQISGGLVPRAGEPGEIQILVRGDEATGAVVRGYVDDRLVGTARAGPDGTAILPLPPMPPGSVAGRVELEPDDLRGDDSGYFAFSVIPPPAVHTAGQISPFLEDALTVLEDAGRIRSAPANEADLLFLSAGAVPDPPPGGTVVLVPPDDAALLPSFNRILGELLPGWRVEAEVRGGEREVAGGDLLPLLPTRSATPLGVHEAHRIHRGEGGEVVELLLLSDGAPWLIEASLGSGALSGAPASVAGPARVIVLASPLRPDASGLPTSAAMLPLVDLLTATATGGAGPSSQRTGEPLPLPRGVATVGLPDGTFRSVEGMSALAATGQSGIYQLLDAQREIVGRIAVNATPPSGASLSPSDAAGRLEDRWPDVTAAEPWPASILSDRRGREVWWPLISLLLLVLLLESWMAASGADRPRERGTLSPSHE